MRIGTETIPRYTIEEVIGDVKKLHDQFGRDDFTKADIAYTLGQSPTSGALMQKIADMKSYQLIQGRGDSFSVTQVGEHATFGDSVERYEALQKIFNNVPLWSKLYDKYRDSIKEEGFANVLSKLTNATVPECEKKAPLLRKQYIGDLKYIKNVERPVKTPEPQKSEARATEAFGRIQSMNIPQVVGNGGCAIIQFPQFGESRVVIRDKKSLRTIRRFLDDLEEYLDSTSNVEQVEQSPESER
ncbi:MAG: hypothetical protein A4E38_00764 [Methanoregulaceae archaeon PtaB.Bin108]|nr:MAG: hypothetical protein A4E38_00764 [Methanoregulaceae archaeon PtaB.Bin108]